MHLSRSKPKGKAVTIVCISDTHELHREVDVPNGDILIHAGDFTMFSKSMDAILDFNRWMGELPPRYKIVVPGNHEFFMESDRSTRNLISSAIVLIDEGVQVMGLQIWGSPVTPLYSGAFGQSSPIDRVRTYSKVPDNTDVLVTHGPPFGVLDRAPGELKHAGCHELLSAVNRVMPKLHVFGHIHGARGILSSDRTVFVNAAVLGPDGGVAASAIALRIRST